MPAIVELAGKAQTATWITSWRGQGVDPVKTIETLQVEQQRVGTDMQKAFDELRAAIDPANRVDQQLWLAGAGRMAEPGEGGWRRDRG